MKLTMVNDERTMIKHPVATVDANIETKTVSLEAVANLFKELNQEGVRYCHWKSNLRLEQALLGQTDLDLLVDRKHAQLFRAILIENNIKPLSPAPGKNYPAIENYLGFDAASGELFHLHVHYQLVLGEQYVKNYHLPLESYLLNATRLQHGVLIPEPEWELIILSIRALLKYRDRDVVKDVLSIRSPGIPAAILEEIEWLRGQASMQRISQILEQIRGVIQVDIVGEFLDTVRDDPRDGYRLFKLRGRLRQALRFCQRHNRFRASMMYFRELWRRRKGLRGASPIRKMISPNGGLGLALIGADGSGKSTMSQIIFDWLNWKLDVHLFYLGSKQPSPLSDDLYLLFRTARRGHRTLSARLGKDSFLTRWIKSLRQALLYSHHLSNGYDRYRRYRISRRKAADGSLVLFDRFPLEHPLDGPKIHLLADGDMGGITRRLIDLERKIYRKFIPPDYMFALDVSPEVSIQRKSDHDLAVIEGKSRYLRGLLNQGKQGSGQLNVIRIDADQPFERVLNQLKRDIWELI